MGGQAGPGGFAGRIGAQVQDADDGGARIAFEVREEHLNPAGTLHGGGAAPPGRSARGACAVLEHAPRPAGTLEGAVLPTLVDTAMGQAVRTTTGEGEVPATSQLTVTYLRPGTPGTPGPHGRVRPR